MNHIESQFSNPRGFVGHLVGLIMAYENRSRNLWALSLLDIQTNDRILEIGFGPGWAIQKASKLAYNGLVAGVDKSLTMVKQATFRNRAEVKSGKVILCHGSAAEIPFDDATFKKVFAVNSFHEWESTSDGLREIKRVLIPGGSFLTVEHPHGKTSEESIKVFGNQLSAQLEDEGFKSAQVFVNSIYRRSAVGVKGEKS